MDRSRDNPTPNPLATGWGSFLLLSCSWILWTCRYRCLMRFRTDSSMPFSGSLSATRVRRDRSGSPWTTAAATRTIARIIERNEAGFTIRWFRNLPDMSVCVCAYGCVTIPEGWMDGRFGLVWFLDLRVRVCVLWMDLCRVFVRLCSAVPVCVVSLESKQCPMMRIPRD